MTSNAAGSGHAFGALVARLRTASGLPQKELARRLGIARPYLATIERGELPGPNVLAALAEWYPAHADELRRCYDTARAHRAGAAPTATPGTPGDPEDEIDMFWRRASGINPQLEGTWHALWLTTVEDQENVNAEVLTFSWRREWLRITNEAPSPDNPKGGYRWRAECRLHDSRYLTGTYVSLDPLNTSKGTLYLVLHRSGTYLLGHWAGANFDSDWAHGLVAIARDPAHLPALLRAHVAAFPAMPYWPAPTRREEAERPEGESAPTLR
jgi:transcriptional regulator with XRE-family HTH domain